MSRQPTRLTRVRFFAWRLTLLLIAGLAFYGGVKLRWRLYHDSEAIRFRGDIQNGWHQGTEVYKAAQALAHARRPDLPAQHAPVAFSDYFAALRGRYDALLGSVVGDDYGLDYPPARLLIMSSWVWYSRNHLTSRPPPAAWDIRLATPLLRLNTLFEALAAVAAFLIIRRVTLLDGSRCAATLGLVGGLLVWFNLPSLLDGHVWPQWDNWVLPFYLGSCWLALRGNWKLCGVLIGLGAMCKGQMLLVAPALLLWPLLRGKWLATIDLLLGFFAAALAFAVPWLLNDPDAVRLFARLALLIVLIICIQRTFRFRWLLFLGSSTLLLSGLAGGSIAWYLVGFAYGARHFHMMLTVGAIPNLAAVLGTQFGWHPDSVVLELSGHHWVFTARELLIACNALGIALCGLALALQSRWPSRRILLALALPWLTTVCLMPQMHERYLLWAAVTTALAAGVSLGTSLIHVLLTIWSAIPIAAGMLDQVDRQNLDPAVVQRLNAVLDILHRCWPADAFSVLTLLAIWMYLCLSPGPRRAQEMLLPAIE